MAKRVRTPRRKLGKSLIGLRGLVDERDPVLVAAPKAMRALARSLNEEFRTEQATRRARAAMEAKRSAILRGQFSVAIPRQKPKRRRTPTRPGFFVGHSVPKVEPRLLIGSLGAMVPPPYDFGWQFESTYGDPPTFSENVRADGVMAFDISDVFRYPDTDLIVANRGRIFDMLYHDSGGSMRSALGISFRPPVTGLYMFSATPIVLYRWFTSSWLAESHSDGWIGWFIDRFALDGTHLGPVLNLPFPELWRDNSYSTSNGDDSRVFLNPGLGLVAPPVFLRDDERYAVWVWCGGRIQAAGYHGTWNSDAESSMVVILPSISWWTF